MFGLYNSKGSEIIDFGNQARWHPTRLADGSRVVRNRDRNIAGD